MEQILGVINFIKVLNLKTNQFFNVVQFVDQQKG